MCVRVCAFVSVCLWLLCCSVSAVERAGGKFWHFSSHKSGWETWKPLPPSWGYAEFVCLIKGRFTQMTKTYFLTYLWWNLAMQGVISAQVLRHGGFCCHITLFVFPNSHQRHPRHSNPVTPNDPKNTMSAVFIKCVLYGRATHVMVERFNVLHTCSSHGCT